MAARGFGLSGENALSFENPRMKRGVDGVTLEAPIRIFEVRLREDGHEHPVKPIRAIDQLSEELIVVHGHGPRVEHLSVSWILGSVIRLSSRMIAVPA